MNGHPANSSANSAAAGVLTPQIPLLAGPVGLSQPIDIVSLFAKDGRFARAQKRIFPALRERQGGYRWRPASAGEQGKLFRRLCGLAGIEPPDCLIARDSTTSCRATA